MSKTTAGWVGVTEICSHLQLSKETIYRMTTNNSIPHIKAGKSLRFNLEEVDAHLKNKSSKVILRKARR